jgi:hypothetical protein
MSSVVSVYADGNARLRASEGKREEAPRGTFVHEIDLTMKNNRRQ